MKAEQYMVSKEQATVKHVGGLRKRHRGQNLATERRQKPKDGSRAKLVAARPEKVAQRKGHRLQGQGKDKITQRTH
jgi:hypothetical protein